MNKNIFSVALVALLFALCTPAEAQQPGKLSRIGYLSPRSPSVDSTRIEAFRQGLRELGYIERHDIAIEYRYAEGNVDHLPDLARELVHQKVDVIVVDGATATTTAKNATKLIPIVMTSASDPVALGLVASLARPAGNITGLTNLAPDLGGKRLELLKEIVPKLSRVGVLADPSTQAYGPQMKEIEVAARALGLQLQPADVRGAIDLASAFSAITKGRAGALIGLQQSTLFNLRERTAELAVKSRLPAMYGDRGWAEAGGLMAYGTDTADLYRRAATYVDKILKGARPAELPVEQPMKFEFVINLKAAKQIGLTISLTVLARADKVIR